MGYSNVTADLNVYGTTSLSDLNVRGTAIHYGSLINYGNTSLANLTTTNLTVTGNFTITATNTSISNSLSIINQGTTTALYVNQNEFPNMVHNVAEFWDHTQLAMVIDGYGNVAIHTTSSPDYALTVRQGALFDSVVTTSLSGTSITSPSISGTTFTGSVFYGATSIASPSFTGTAFTGSTVYGATVASPSFTGGTFQGSTVTASTGFTGAAFTGGTFQGTTMSGTTITASTGFTGAAFTGGTLQGDSIASPAFTGTAFTGSTVYGATVLSPSFTGTAFTGGSVYGATIASPSFTGTTYSGATFQGTSFVGSSGFTGTAFSGGTFQGSTVTAGSVIATTGFTGYAYTGGYFVGTTVSASTGFTGAAFSGGTFQGSTVSGTTITASSGFTGAAFTGGTFQGSTMSGTTITAGTGFSTAAGWVNAANFTGGAFSGSTVNTTGAIVAGTTVSGTTITASTGFTGAAFSGGTFQGSTVSGTTITASTGFTGAAFTGGTFQGSTVSGTTITASTGFTGAAFTGGTFYGGTHSGTTITASTGFTGAAFTGGTFSVGNILLGASQGTSGQVIASTGSGIQWLTSGATTLLTRAGDSRSGIAPSLIGANQLAFYLGTMANSGGSFSDSIILNSWNDSSAGNTNLLMLNKATPGIRNYQGTYGSATNFSTYSDCLMVNSSGSITSPVTYDTLTIPSVATTYSLTVPSVGGTNGFFTGTGDGGSLATYNARYQAWWGLAISDYAGTVRVVCNSRDGTWDTTGGYRINGTGVIDGSRNLTNIGTITSTGTVIHNGSCSIGTSSGPGYTLDVAGDMHCSGAFYCGNNSTATAVGSIGGRMYFGGTYGDASYGDGGQILSTLYATTESSELVIFKGNDIAGASGPDRIRLRAAQICFDTYTGASSDPLATNIRMTLNESGNLGINRTDQSYKLDVSGDIRATGSVIANSDKRIKKNIEPIEDALEKVKKISGYTFERNDIDGKFAGVIAQEIIEVLPEVVQQDDKGMYSVAYGNITALLIQALKEETAKREALEKQVAAILEKLNQHST